MFTSVYRQFLSEFTSCSSMFTHVYPSLPHVHPCSPTFTPVYLMFTDFTLCLPHVHFMFTDFTLCLLHVHLCYISWLPVLPCVYLMLTHFYLMFTYFHLCLPHVHSYNLTFTHASFQRNHACFMNSVCIPVYLSLYKLSLILGPISCHISVCKQTERMNTKSMHTSYIKACRDFTIAYIHLLKSLTTRMVHRIGRVFDQMCLLHCSIV